MSLEKEFVSVCNYIVPSQQSHTLILKTTQNYSVIKLFGSWTTQMSIE
jgi:hypothetical protein